MNEQLDHPCKASCSGWSQGYDAAMARANRLVEALEKIADSMSPGTNGLRRFSFADMIAIAKQALSEYRGKE